MERAEERNMIERPSGTVTFLFTDIEGSTRMWEAEPDAMHGKLAEHDEVLRSAIERHGGWLFKHTGDGCCAAFRSATGGLHAAIEAQRLLALPVRMGLATGEVEVRGDDYFGQALNRAARIMDVGHGGQILVSRTTAAVAAGVDLIDLGEHRLRDLSGVDQLFQVRADGLEAEFAPLQTLDTVPGNLGVESTTLVGRELATKEVAELVRQHQLVTMTGVGGVGKTRLATRVAAELRSEFPDGVWFVPLAPVGDPDAVPDAVATALVVTLQPGRSVTSSIASLLAGPRRLIVLDNCEHVIDAVADLIDEILAASTTVSIIATSREGTQARGEYLWPVPALEVGDGSDAVELFMERAVAANPAFTLDTEADREAVSEICRRLDGIALAIELAAARMVLMTPSEVLARLNDRFRLLSGSRRGLQRHQTLRHAVQWSYDLLDADERALLDACSVFSGGFDVGSLTAVCERFDEYMVLDVLDSLVRKSLVTANRVGDGIRYGLLETIREFIVDQHAGDPAALDSFRSRHAAYFGTQSVRQWERWEGPQMRDAADWVETELDNLRTAFGWARDHDDPTTASAIAAHAATIAFVVHRFEPIRWAIELLPAATAHDLAYLPRLLTAASACSFTGHPDDAVAYAQRATSLQDDPRYQPFDRAWAQYREAAAHRYVGELDQYLEICEELSNGPGLSRVIGLVGTATALLLVGRRDEAVPIMDQALEETLQHGNPYWVSFAYLGQGLVHTEHDPLRALEMFRRGIEYAGIHRLPLYEAAIARELAGLEAIYGDMDQAVRLFNRSLDSFHQAGNTTNLAYTFASMVVYFSRVAEPQIAATVYGATLEFPNALEIAGLTESVDLVRSALGDEVFDHHVASGAGMDMAEVVAYCRENVRRAAGRTDRD